MHKIARVFAEFRYLIAVFVCTVFYPIYSLSFPSVFPTGTTIFDPEKTWGGFTIYDAPAPHGATLIDMNGNIIRQWKELTNVPSPFRILPGGHVMGGDKPRRPHQEAIALVQLDWNGNEVWRYDRLEQVVLGDSEQGDGDIVLEKVWSSRIHHDWQREGNPIGYYSPGMESRIDGGKTLVLAHKNLSVPEISPKQLEDDYIYELNWEGDIVWDWLASDHVDELGFSEDARNAIHRSVEFNDDRNSADWLHINSAAYLGPNQWYEDGDLRFHPDNIMISSRTANIIAIISRNGDIIWRLGPDYEQIPAQAKIGQIIGQHNPHLIPKGLPGEGNLLVFDNGGQGGFGFANPARPNGTNAMTRDSSRVLEINPITLEVVWEYTLEGTERYQFYSAYVSNAQRLPNGNTLVNEGMDGRIFELTSEDEIVWEYVNPFLSEDDTPSRRIYRAYRVPYAWIPQVDQPEERAVIPPDLESFRVPMN